MGLFDYLQSEDQIASDFFFNFTESRYEKRFPQALNFNGSWYPMVEITLHKRIPDMSLERQLNITSDYLFIILWNVDSLYNDIEYQAHKKNPGYLLIKLQEIEHWNLLYFLA